MKRLIVSLFIASSIHAADVVFPTRMDYGMIALNSSMPYTLWTNCVFVMTAEMPILNSGTTNAQWLDWSPLRGASDQPILNSQPTRIFTNGLWAFQFDGIDDGVTLDKKYLSSKSEFTFFLTLKRLGDGTGASTSDGVFGDGSSSVHFMFLKSSGNARIYAKTDGAASQVMSVPSDVKDGNWHNYAVVKTATNWVVYQDGVIIGTSTNRRGTTETGAFKTHVGSLDASYSKFNGLVSSAMVFTNALSSNAVWSLSR